MRIKKSWQYFHNYNQVKFNSRNAIKQPSKTFELMRLSSAKIVSYEKCNTPLPSSTLCDSMKIFDSKIYTSPTEEIKGSKNICENIENIHFCSPTNQQTCKARIHRKKTFNPESEAPHQQENVDDANKQVKNK